MLTPHERGKRTLSIALLSGHGQEEPMAQPGTAFCPTPLTRDGILLQVSRALTIKAQYLSKTAVDLEAKRKVAEQEASSGILGLGLLGHDEAKAKVEA